MHALLRILLSRLNDALQDNLVFFPVGNKPEESEAMEEGATSGQCGWSPSDND